MPRVLSSQAITLWSSLDARQQIVLVDRIEDTLEKGQRHRWTQKEFKRSLRFLMQNLLDGHILLTDEANWIPIALKELAALPATDVRVQRRLGTMILQNPWDLN